MIIKNLLAVAAVGVLFTTASLAQDAAPVEQPKVETPPATEKMSTLFSNAKNPVKHVGLSFASEFQYGSLAGAFTPMSGGSGMLHINKKLGLGMAAYGTVDGSFAPTSLSSKSALNINAMYGGFKLEYTPKPNAAIHVSFPLLVGGGMASIDSVETKTSSLSGRGKNKGFRYESGGKDNDGNSATFMVIQPGINIEANVVRFIKIYAGASYRIVPTLTNATSNTTVYPALTTTQLGGFNVSVGAKIGIFDYQLHQKRTRAIKIPKIKRRERR